MTRRTTVLALALFSLVGLNACRKKVAAAPTPVASTANANEESLAAQRARERADSIAAADAAAARNASDAQRTQAEMAALLTQKVYFDYDRDVLRDDTRTVLDAKVPVLLANPGVSLLISGHTDERGTAEYNLALGQRRAAQVKRYLASKGVPETRLTAQSVGDAQPAVQGTDESAYSQNRRAEFEAEGANALARPRS
jgi:peptidoglycan-associated lipoprotein